MALVLCLDRPSRRRLQKLDRRTSDADQRVRIRVLLKISSGMSRNAAAHEVGCVPSTAWMIVERFRLWGEASLIDGRRENGERKVDDDLRGGIWQILERNPRAYGYSRTTWTLELLGLVIEEVLHVVLSVGHLWRVLKRMRIRWGRPRPVVNCPWKSADRERRIAELRHLASSLPANEALVYADEIDIHLNPKIGPDWMLPGIQKLVVTPGKNVKRYLAGAYDPINERMVYVEGDRKASWLFLNLLHALMDAYGWARKVHVILDNYVIHKSALIVAAMRGMPRIVLHFLPPYCPQENKIEREWLDLHANVTRNHCCRSIQELMEDVRAYLQNRYRVFRGACLG